MLNTKSKTDALTIFSELIKCQSCHHIETNQLICSANQLTGFYMMETLAFNGLICSKLTIRTIKHRQMTPLWCLYCQLLTYSEFQSIASNFEQVVTCRVVNMNVIPKISFHFQSLYL